MGKMLNFVITEILLLGLSVGAAAFITMAYTRLPFSEIPPRPVVFGALLLYVIRFFIRWAIVLQNRIHYHRLKSDSHIKVYDAPPKFRLWKILVWVLIIAFVLYLILACRNLEAFKSFQLPINLSSR